MTADDRDGAADRSLGERISHDIRQEAEGRSDAYVYENYEDAASLLRSAANRYDELTSQEGRSGRLSQEIAKADTDLREREAAWKAWSELAEERNQAADLAEERRLETLERSDSADREPRAYTSTDKNGPAMDKSSEGSAAPINTERLVAIDYAPTPAMRDDEQVAIYAGKDAYLVAMTGPASEQASHDRATKLVNDPDFRRLVNDAVPEAQNMIGKGTHIEYEGGSSAYPERMAALARNGAADRTEIVIYGDADREKVLALAMAESESIQNSLAPAPHDRARQLAADFRGMSQDERLQDTRTNSAAKQLAAIDTMIDRKYGHGTPEADRMKEAAREAVAQTLESGKEIRAPRLRAAEKDVELRRDDRQRTADVADRTAKDLDR